MMDYLLFNLAKQGVSNVEIGHIRMSDISSQPNTAWPKPLSASPALNISLKWCGTTLAGGACRMNSPKRIKGNIRRTCTAGRGLAVLCAITQTIKAQGRVLRA